MYLVTIRNKKVKLEYLCLLKYKCPKLHPNAPSFEINGHEASFWYTYNAYSVNKLSHKTYLVMYLVTIIKKKKSNLSIFACLLIYAPMLHPDDLTVELNGHKASV